MDPVVVSRIERQFDLVLLLGRQLHYVGPSSVRILKASREVAREALTLLEAEHPQEYLYHLLSRKRIG